MNKNMIQTRCDSQGRVYLKETLRTRYGDAFVVVESRTRISLLPEPIDVVQDLAEIGRRPNGESLEHPQTAIRDRARKEMAL